MSCQTEVGTIFMPDGSEVSYDGLPSTNFKCVFDKIPNTIFFLQRWNVPRVSIGAINRATPHVDLNEIGEKMVFEQFNIDFMIDKNLKNYQEIFNWMKRISVNGNQRDETACATIIINNSKQVRFIDVWPTALGDMQFVANATNMDYLKCTATFNYDWFEFTEA